MSTRIQEWLQAENTVVKSYEQLQEENEDLADVQEYNEKIVNPWNEQNRMEDEIRRQLGVPPTWARDEEKIEFHRRQLALLEKADRAPRCGHVYSDGTRCRAPKLRKDKVCYAHARMLAVRPRRLNLPPLEDANAVMLWLMEVSRALLEGEITERTAGLLFYGLQMAMATARWTTFAQTKPEEMVRSADFTAKGARFDVARNAKIAKDRRNGKDKTLLLMNTDDTDQEKEAEERRDFTAENAEIAEKEGPGGNVEQAQRKPVVAVREAVSVLQVAGISVENPGDESAKSLCFGVDGDRGGQTLIIAKGDTSNPTLCGADRLVRKQGVEAAKDGAPAELLGSRASGSGADPSPATQTAQRSAVRDPAGIRDGTSRA